MRLFPKRQDIGIKYLLTRIGERLSAKSIYNLNAAINYLEVGRWMRANGYRVIHRVDPAADSFSG